MTIVLLFLIGLLLITIFVCYNKSNAIQLELQNQKKANELEIIKSKSYIEKITQLTRGVQKLYDEKLDLTKQNNLMKQENLSLNEGFKLKDDLLEGLKNNSTESISRITSLYADFLLIQFDISSRYLKIKKHPAHIEARRIQDLKAEYKHYIELYKLMVYKYEYLLQLFPDLTNYVDEFNVIRELESKENLQDLQEDNDRVSYYISKEEYMKLGTNERNQLALDRYIKGKKSKWQVGRDYELFCGYYYERNNWEVQYVGIEKKLEDMGRDLIATKDDVIHIIQCKYWSQTKQIHEKHIAQLYGTTIAYKIEHGADLNVKPVFISNIELSEKAKNFAKYLDVEVLCKAIEKFPRIKCNYGKDEDGFDTKIYHLPFDQQYDKIIMNRKDNFFAFNVEEAFSKGFRRAYRYYG